MISNINSLIIMPYLDMDIGHDMYVVVGKYNVAILHTIVQHTRMLIIAKPLMLPNLL